MFLWRRPGGWLLFVSSFNEELHPRLLSLRSNVHLAASQRTRKAGTAEDSEAWTYVTFFFSHFNFFPNELSALWQSAIRSVLRFLVTVGVFEKRRLRSPVTTSRSERGGGHFRTRFISSKQNGCQRDSTVLTLNKSVRREADGDFAPKRKSLQARLKLMKLLDDVKFKRLQQWEMFTASFLSAEETVSANKRKRQQNKQITLSLSPASIILQGVVSHSRSSRLIQPRVYGPFYHKLSFTIYLLPLIRPCIGRIDCG